eukprot:TRINITY_DN8148_c0_g1_i14.p1 TRINITY_DN8148_c0_g1~~TRINITY_DN8148_c0_g1_i14.p1  ORF type:complete len:213 (+),score=24.02 TRINITY_DN8148_c0_g1_i14:76-714(+)
MCIRDSINAEYMGPKTPLGYAWHYIKSQHKFIIRKTMENQETDLKQYLKYADEVERADPIMALHCRLYFVENYVKSKKKEGVATFTPDEMKFMNEALNRVEKTQKECQLTKEQKQERARQYCLKMYQKIMETIRSPGADKIQSIEILQTMINFISIIATFGPLAPEWVSMSKAMNDVRRCMCEDNGELEESAWTSDPSCSAKTSRPYPSTCE